MKKLKEDTVFVEFQLITDNPNDYDDEEITEKYLRLVENQLHEDPHHIYGLIGSNIRKSSKRLRSNFFN